MRLPNCTTRKTRVYFEIMGQILATAIMLYGLFVAGYFAWEWLVASCRKIRQGKREIVSKPLPMEDIVGKSGFDLRHSLPQAATLIHNEKRVENASTFAAVNEQNAPAKPPAAIPVERLNDVFSSEPEDVDIVIDNDPDEEATDEDDGIIDREESEDEPEQDEETYARGMATGLMFDELSGMAETVNDPNVATQENKLSAGRVLVEVRKTDMFEQIVSGALQKRVTAGQLMDEYLSAYNRRKREESNDDGGVKAPKDFNARAFAR